MSARARARRPLEALVVLALLATPACEAELGIRGGGQSGGAPTLRPGGTDAGVRPDAFVPSGGTGTGSGTGSGSGTGGAAPGETGPMVGMVAAHNAVRAAAPGASTPLPSVTWDPEIAAIAQSWSDRLASSGCGLMHSSPSQRPGLGENLYMTSGTATAQQVVDAWASEISCFRPGGSVDSCSCTCGHYTQIVWRDSIRIGCAVARCGGRGEVWTCNYGPAGNYIGRPPY